MRVKNYRDFLLNENFIKWRLFRTEEQDEQWEKFRLENPHFEQPLNEAIRQFNALEMNRTFLSKNEKEVIYSLITQNINRYKKQKRWRIWLVATASVFAITILSTLFVPPNKNGKPTLTIENNRIMGQALPGEEIYLLSGEEIINIANQSDIQLQQDAKIVITNNTEAKKELTLKSVKMNKLVVPFGKRSTLMLADGTKIYLNSGTQVDFPSEFNGKTREIHVDGEIFIEVTKDSKTVYCSYRPNGYSGTRNLIQCIGLSYRYGKTVVLIEGKVSIKTDQQVTEMLPNEKVELANNRITKETVDVSEYISWTKGVLEFYETPVSEILKKVGRYYNVQFESSPEIPLNARTCSGKLFLSNNLDSVMTSISVLSSTNYRRENDIIYITK